MNRRSMLQRGAVLALSMWIWSMVASAQGGGLSPSQAAFLRAENRRIEDYFVSQVARAVGVDPERVRRAMPDEGRITVTVSRLIPMLEQDLGAPLSEEQRAAILRADEERRAALARVREGAARR